jgi:hypothetical protein
MTVTDERYWTVNPCHSLRLAAGEAMAFLHEYWGECIPGFEYPEDEAGVVEEIINRLRDLASEGSKRMR